ncbi:MAG: hypothetical protein LBB75_09845 [Oscillospiraceae bacterium]|nr:hypothetical protein [Oscillospiraceae bacterium]
MEWKISFRGNDLENLGEVLDWAGAFISQWLPSFSSLSLSIPPEAEKLWEAFYTTMTTKYDDDQRTKQGIDLGDKNTNEFTICACGRGVPAAARGREFAALTPGPWWGKVECTPPLSHYAAYGGYATSPPYRSHTSPAGDVAHWGRLWQFPQVT